MLAGLEGALAARKKYVDEAGVTTESSGTGSAMTTSAGKFAYGARGQVKSETGFTGLVNQGATCYLNSLLQALFMVPEFRRALFLWKYNKAEQDEERCMSRQLQRLFSQLQMSLKPAVTTGILTKSFGWTNSEAFVQHDAHECMSAIFEQLQIQSIGSYIGQYHQGLVQDVVCCSNCSDKRSRGDTFRDLHLEVRGMRSIEQALAAYIAPEDIDAVECSRCNSRCSHRKALQLDALPVVLTLQLKRFDLDYTTWQRVKLNDAVRIPKVLNMAPFVADQDASAPCEYTLLSVLSHIGSAHSGHYFSYTYDTVGQRWLKFNDATVEAVEDAQLEAILGGADIADTTSPKASLNAYMLIYRKVISIPPNLCPAGSPYTYRH